MNCFSKFWFRKCCDSLFKPWPTGYAYNPAYINACLSINNSYIDISKCLKKRNFSSIMQRNRNAFALLWHFAYGLLIVFGKSRTIVRYKYYYLTCFLFNLVHRGTYILKPHRLNNVKIHIYGKILSLTMSLWSEATEGKRRLGTFLIKPSNVVTSSRRLNLNDSIDYVVFPQAIKYIYWRVLLGVIYALWRLIQSALT